MKKEANGFLGCCCFLRNWDYMQSDVKTETHDSEKEQTPAQSKKASCEPHFSKHCPESPRKDSWTRSQKKVECFVFCAEERRSDDGEREEHTTLQPSLPHGPKAARTMEAGAACHS